MSSAENDRGMGVLGIAATDGGVAGTIAFMHCDDDDPTTFAHLIVTASVDEIHQYQALTLHTDLLLSGTHHLL